MFKRIGAFFLDLLQTLVFAIAIFLFVYLLILQPHKIKGASMEPNFPDAEYLLTDKVTYRFKEPLRGDVVVFKAPINQDEEFIKRIIGLPGESVSIKDDHVYINGKKLSENYLDEKLTTTPGAFLQEAKEVVVPGGQYFVLGDNRPHSSDSRAWGFVAKDKITGRAWLTYWPPQKAGIIKGITYDFF